MLKPRTLVAADISLHGRPLIIAEFVVGSCLSVALGLWLLLAGSANWQRWFGLYLVGIGLNYVPLLISAIAIPSREAARAISTDSLDVSKLTRLTSQSLLLLVPLWAVVASIGIKGRRRNH